jgi:hypothetical protein
VKKALNFLRVVLVAAGLLYPKVAGTQSPANPVPFMIAMCEDSDGCSNWSFQGKQGIGRWADGAVANLTVEQLDTNTVSIRRADTAGIAKGLTALYTGTRTGDWIEGTVAASWPGHAPDGKTNWHALVAPPIPTRPFSRSSASAWVVCEDFASACARADPPTRYVWAIDGQLGSVRYLQDTSGFIGLVIDHFEPDSIVMRRVDLSGAFAGLTGIYTGRRQGNAIEGTATWIWPGHFPKPQSGKWVALPSPKNCDRPGNSAFTAQSAKSTAIIASMLADKPAGFGCYLQSAQLGDAEAEQIVGSLYYTGDGTSQDYGQALSWFKQSAQQYNDDAFMSLSVMYQLGRGTPVNLQLARYFADRAELNKRYEALLTTVANGSGRGSTALLNMVGDLAAYWFLGPKDQDEALGARIGHEEAVIAKMDEGLSRVQAEEAVYREDHLQKTMDTFMHGSGCALGGSHPVSREEFEHAQETYEACETRKSEEAAEFNLKSAEYLQCVHTYVDSNAIESHCKYF